MKATLRDEFLNIPNMLTLARIAGIPLVVFFIWRGDPKDCVIAAWLYSVVSVTDYIDGWLARRWNMVTVMGKFLDPLADKLMVMAMLIMLVALNRVPASLVVVLLAREMTINGLRAIASTEGLVIPAGEMGKYKTALQMIGIMCLLIHYPYAIYFFGLTDAVVNFNLVGIWVMIVSVVISIASAAGYITNFFRALDERRAVDAVSPDGDAA